MADPDWVLFLNGTFGAGKSTVAAEIGVLLADANVPFCLLDLDWFNRSWPASGLDPNNDALGAGNLAAVWRRYRAVGPRQPVACGVLAGPEDRHRCAEAFGLPLRSVRLTASPATVHGRLLNRSARQGVAHDWPLARHERLAQELAAADADEVVIATDDLPPVDVAVRILAHFGILTS